MLFDTLRVGAEKLRPTTDSIARTQGLAHGSVRYCSDETDSRLRPLARRRLSTSRPFLVAIRTRNPWARARRRRFGWYVRFMMTVPRKCRAAVATPDLMRAATPRPRTPDSSRRWHGCQTPGSCPDWSILRLTGSPTRARTTPAAGPTTSRMAVGLADNATGDPASGDNRRAAFRNTPLAWWRGIRRRFQPPKRCATVATLPFRQETFPQVWKKLCIFSGFRLPCTTGTPKNRRSAQGEGQGSLVLQASVLVSPCYTAVIPEVFRGESPDATMPVNVRQLVVVT